MSVYNGERHLREAVDSILDQTFTDFEFIIINDGSNDDTRQILDSYSDPRVHLISQQNQGLVASLNNGLKIARGKYIARMDADDISHPDRLEKQFQYCEAHPGVGILGTAFAMINEDTGKVLGFQYPPCLDIDLKRALFVRNPFGHGSMLLRRDILVKYGQYEDVGPIEDYYLWMKLAPHTVFATLPEVLYRWRISAKGISQTKGQEQARLTEKVRCHLIKSMPVPKILLRSILQNYREFKQALGHTSLPVEYTLDQIVLAKILIEQGHYIDAFLQWIAIVCMIDAYRLLLQKIIHSPRKIRSRLISLLGNKKPIRVLIVRNAFSHDFGGAETYALNLAIALKHESIEPIVVTQVATLLEKCRSHGVQAIRGPWHSKQGWGRVYRFWGPLVTLWYMVFILLKRIDIVHPQSRDDFLFATKAAQLLRKKVIWTDHGDLKYIFADSAPPTLTGRILKLAAYTRSVVAVSNSEKNAILSACPAFPNLEVVYNGIFSPSPAEPVARVSKFVIGATSRLVKAKGIAELIEAFADIKQLDQTELWLVGEGNDRDDFKAEATELGIADRVMFLGYQTNIWPYLAAFDVFVHPSYHEAFSLSIIEGAMAGKPIIATDTGGNSEIVTNDIGILVPVGNAAALSEALIKLLGDPKLRQQLGRNAHKLAREKFEFQSIVKNQVLPLYNN